MLTRQILGAAVQNMSLAVGFGGRTYAKICPTSQAFKLNYFGTRRTPRIGKAHHPWPDYPQSITPQMHAAFNLPSPRVRAASDHCATRKRAMCTEYCGRIHRESRHLLTFPAL